MSDLMNLKEAIVNGKLEEAKALIQGDKSDEEWEDLQSAITAAEHTLRVATTQASLNTALEDLTKAMEKFTTGLTAPTVTAVAYDGNELTIEEINHYSDDANWKAYGQSISGVTVNGTEYKEYTNDDDPESVYSLSVLHGLTIGSGKFTEGRNAIVIKAKGYKDKTVVFAKSGDTCVLISQTDGDSEPVTPPQPTIKDPTEDGVYTLTFKTTKADSEEDSMLSNFFAAKAKLQVKDGKMTIHVSLVSQNIVNVFVGTKEEAQADGAELIEPTTDEVTYSDGTTDEVYGFDIPVEKLDEDFNVAIIGKKGTWYDHVVSVSNPVPQE